MTPFPPNLKILPAAQARLWSALAEIPRGFVLYGGTALALRLGHRNSLDFDLFSSDPFEPQQLLDRLALLKQAEILQSSTNTLTVLVNRDGPVKISFFGGLSIGRVGEPDLTVDGVLQVASLLDLGATKAAVVPQRAESKDYLDILALLRGGVTLAQMIGAARALYGEQFNPAVTLKALIYFRDGDLATLPERDQQQLIAEVERTTDFPGIKRRSERIAAGECI